MVRLGDLAGKRVYLDTNIFIYALEGLAEYEVVIARLGARIDSGDIHAVTSELTLAECLVKPLAEQDDARVDTYGRAICESPSLRVAPVARGILVAAARLRGSHGIGLADAIHVATAVSEECAALLTNDRRLTSALGVRVVPLSQLAT